MVAVDNVMLTGCAPAPLRSGRCLAIDPGNFAGAGTLCPAMRILSLLASVAAAALLAGLLWPLVRGPRVAEAPGPEPRSPTDVYDPVQAGEPLPPGFRQLLPRDGIRPIYRPVAMPAAAAAWDASTPVIGVVVGDQARAYPVHTLNWREMVNDRLGGTPILVSW